MKNCKTPFTGAVSAIGFVASIIVLSARFLLPDFSKTFKAAVPLTARTIISPKLAACSKEPIEALEPATFNQSFSLFGLPVHILT